jgi:N-acyl-D-amino-acid deacylase
MTVLIKNGLVYDGSGEPPVKRNILVQRGVIAHIGVPVTARADATIDASNGIVTPGFIDVNTSSDHFLSLFSSPEQRTFIAQGVTTIIGGNCGTSLAPLLGFPIDQVVEWEHPTGLNTNWATVRQYLDTLDRFRLGVNFGTLVGFSAVRRLLTSGERRDLSTPERMLMRRIVERAYGDGALGFSMNASFVGTGHIPSVEVDEIAELTAKMERLCAVHVRDTSSDIVSAVQRALDVANRTHVCIELSHFMPYAGATSRYLESIRAIERSAAVSSVHFDVYPFDTIEKPAITLLPAWAHRAEATELRGERVRKHLDGLDFANIRIGHTLERSLRFLEGKRLADFASDSNTTPIQAFLKLLALSRCRATVISRDVDFPTLEKMMASPSALIASNSAGLDTDAFTDERGRGTFPTFLAWAERTKTLTLGQAIARVTSAPASLYRLEKRGRIAENHHADIVVLRDLKPVTVLVNGTIAYDNGAFTGVRTGTTLRGRNHA